jgi:LmbE family N-acetylglucosaminyl deacetylase
MAYYPILQCFRKTDKWFTGVTCSDGAGSAREGDYADVTNEQMVQIRQGEQRKAATVGAYAAQFQLNHPSESVKAAQSPAVLADLVQILQAAQPEEIYTHNLADKHDAHVGVALKLIAAIRSLPKEKRPRKLVGCEVWRDLDWLNDKDKVVMNVDGHGNLADALMGVYDSQISGGKRYDLATRGRRQAHATYFETLATDKAQNLIYGMDLTPLILDDSMEPQALYMKYMKNFESEVMARLGKLTGK